LNWKSLSDVPVTATHSVPLSLIDKEVSETPVEESLPLDSSNYLRGKHSSSLKAKEFLSWAPFSNTHSSKLFQVVECPSTPVPGYPINYNMMTILGNWNTDSTDIPEQHYDSLCHFDFQNATDLEKAYTYRKAEVPFIVYNIPEVDEVVKKWNNIDYLQNKLGKPV
jgi:hypothetical protein